MRVASYEVEETIGEGGMARVYRARDVRSDELVALKVLRSERADPEGEIARRFEREMRAAASIDHPNTVRVIEYGADEDGVLYLAMVVLGGVGTTFGAVWGAIALTVLFPLMEQIGHALPFPDAFSSDQRAALIFFPLLCLFLVFEPLGLLGIWLRVKRYFMAWPFKY